MGIVGVASLILVAFVACSQAQADANTQQLARQFQNRGACLFPGMACAGGSCECRTRTNIIVVVVINNRRQRRRLWRSCDCAAQNPLTRPRPRPNRRPRVNRQRNAFTIPCGFFAGGQRQRFCHNRCQRCSRRSRFPQCIANGAPRCSNLSQDEAPEPTVDAQGNPVETTTSPAEDLDDAAEAVKPETETVTSTESVEKATPTDVAADEMTQLVKEAEKKMGEVIEKIQQDNINLGPEGEKALAIAAANMKTAEKISKAIENDEVSKMTTEEVQTAIDAEKKAEGAKTAEDESATLVAPPVKTAHQIENIAGIRDGDVGTPAGRK